MEVLQTETLLFQENNPDAREVFLNDEPLASRLLMPEWNALCQQVRHMLPLVATEKQHDFRRTLVRRAQSAIYHDYPRLKVSSEFSKSCYAKIMEEVNAKVSQYLGPRYKIARLNFPEELNEQENLDKQVTYIKHLQETYPTENALIKAKLAGAFPALNLTSAQKENLWTTLYPRASYTGPEVVQADEEILIMPFDAEEVPATAIGIAELDAMSFSEHRDFVQRYKKNAELSLSQEILTHLASFIAADNSALETLFETRFKRGNHDSFRADFFLNLSSDTHHCFMNALFRQPQQALSSELLIAITRFGPEESSINFGRLIANNAPRVTVELVNCLRTAQLRHTIRSYAYDAHNTFSPDVQTAIQERFGRLGQLRTLNLLSPETADLVRFFDLRFDPENVETKNLLRSVDSASYRQIQQLDLNDLDSEVLVEVLQQCTFRAESEELFTSLFRINHPINSKSAFIYNISGSQFFDWLRIFKDQSLQQEITLSSTALSLIAHKMRANLFNSKALENFFAAASRHNASQFTLDIVEKLAEKEWENIITHYRYDENNLFPSAVTAALQEKLGRQKILRLLAPEPIA